MGPRFAVALSAAAALVACAGDKKLACDPATDDSCSVGAAHGNPCVKDADCGDGRCQAGVCVGPGTAAQASQCAGVTCAAGQFCADGKCVAAGQCKPADPACIYIPHGSFEPPVHAWWWPWLTPAGPDATGGNNVYRPDLDYTDYTQVMSTPVVMRLHKTDAEPAVVFNTFKQYYDGSFNVGTLVETQGVMRAIRGSDGSPLWTAPRQVGDWLQYSVDGNSGIAAGDCLGTGEVCFITGGWDPNDVPTPANPTLRAHEHGGLIAFGSDGRVLWVNRAAQLWWGAPAIARLLPSGPPQVVVGNGVYDAATGKTLCPQTTSPLDQVGGNGDGTLSAIADIDLDGVPEILTGNQAYKLRVDPSSATGYSCKAVFGAGVQMPGGKPCAGGSGSTCPDGFPAVANFAGYGAAMGLKPDDPHPQVVVVSHGTLRIHDWTGGMLLAPIPLPAFGSNCPDPTYNPGGAPTIADFDGDGLPEIGVASQSAYSVWKPGKGFIWSSKTFDCSANTGSSVFDFEGKGQATAVYSDQCFMRVYDGKTGNVLIQEKNSSCTAYEMPVVADIDGSGRAKILVPNNDICLYDCPWGSQYPSNYAGLKALKSPSDKWVNTRSVWNEHTYHVTNVGLDGSLPFPEPASWDKSQGAMDSYRQNVQGQGTFSAPDLATCDVTLDFTLCRQGSATATATVYNGGAIPALPGAVVSFYAVLADGSTAKLGDVATTTLLQPGQSEKVSIPWKDPPQLQPVKVRAIVDEAGLIGDCHRENNTADSSALQCAPIG